MPKQIRILHLEDDTQDTELVQAMLRAEGIASNCTRVETEDQLVAALESGQFDLILADYTLPRFHGARLCPSLQKNALRCLSYLCPARSEKRWRLRASRAAPRINVLKQKMSRLVPAVRRALKEADELRKRKEAEAELRESEERAGLIMEKSLDAVITIDTSGVITDWNSQAETTFGWHREEILGKRLLETIIPQQYREAHSRGFDRFLSTGEGPILNKRIEAVALHRDGHEFPIELTVLPLWSRGNLVFSALLRDITERKQAEITLQGRYRELQTLQEISQSILNSADLKQVLEGILERAMAIGAFDTGVISLLNREKDVLTTAAILGYRDPQNAPRPRRPVAQATGGGTILNALMRDEIRIEENVPAAEGWRGAKREGLQAAISVPVRAQGEVLGILHLGSGGTHIFSPEEIRLLEAIGSHVGIAVQKAMLYEHATRHLQRIRALHEIDLAITSTLNLKAVLDILLENIDRFLPYPAVSAVRLWNNRTGTLEPVACHNIALDEWQSEMLGSARDFGKEIIESKAPLIIADLQTDPRTKPIGLFRTYGLISYLGTPLIVKDEILGILGYYTNEKHEFSSEEVEFMSTLAGQAAVAIHNAQLYEQTRKQAYELKRVCDDLETREQIQTLLKELSQDITTIYGHPPG